MPIYNIYNTDLEHEDFIEDAYYIKSDKPICTKIDFCVSLFNITIISLIFYYLHN